MGAQALTWLVLNMFNLCFIRIWNCNLLSSYPWYYIWLWFVLMLPLVIGDQIQEVREYRCVFFRLAMLSIVKRKLMFCLHGAKSLEMLLFLNEQKLRICLWEAWHYTAWNVYWYGYLEINVHIRSLYHSMLPPQYLLCSLLHVLAWKPVDGFHPTPRGLQQSTWLGVVVETGVVEVETASSSLQYLLWNLSLLPLTAQSGCKPLSEANAFTIFAVKMHKMD